MWLGTDALGFVKGRKSWKENVSQVRISQDGGRVSKYLVEVRKNPA